MDQPLYLASVFRFYRKTVTVPAHGNNGILKIGAPGAVYQPVKGGVHPVVNRVHIPPDPLQLTAGVVCDLFLGDNAAVDFI